MGQSEFIDYLKLEINQLNKTIRDLELKRNAVEDKFREVYRNNSKFFILFFI